jgi:DNA-binding response OmpR family regulator
MKKILIIDDNLAILKSLEMLLEINLYAPLIAHDGFEGIAIAKRKQST